MESCGWDGYECGEPATVKGYCRRHYTAMWQRAKRQANARAPRLCDVCGTEYVPRQDGSRYCSRGCKNRRRTPTVAAAVARGSTVPPTPATVECVVCGAETPATRRGKGGGLKRYCSARCNVQANHYWRLYRLTPAQVREMRAGGCAICGRPEALDRGGRSTLHIDHCHQTGVVRGVLCLSCNISLGHFKHDPELLRRAIDYLGAAVG